MPRTSGNDCVARFLPFGQGDGVACRSGKDEQSGLFRHGQGRGLSVRVRDGPLSTGDARNVNVHHTRTLRRERERSGRAGRVLDEYRNGVPERAARDLLGFNLDGFEGFGIRRVADVHRVQKFVGRFSGVGRDLDASPVTVVFAFFRRDLAAVQVVVLAFPADLLDLVAAENVLQDEFPVARRNRDRLAGDRRLLDRVEQEDRAVGRVLRFNMVVDEEVRLDVVAPGVEHRQHPSRDLVRDVRVVRLRDIARNIGVDGGLAGVTVGVTGRLTHRVGTALPSGKRARFGEMPLLQGRETRARTRTGKDDRVVRDGSLMVLDVMRRAVTVVIAGIPGKQTLVVDLEGAGVAVIVVRRRAVADLHQDRHVVRRPAGVRDDLSEVTAVIEDQVKFGVAVSRRFGRSHAGPELEDVGRIGVARRLRPRGDRRVAEEMGGNLRRERELVQRLGHLLFKVAVLVVALVEEEVFTVDDI